MKMLLAFSLVMILFVISECEARQGVPQTCLSHISWAYKYGKSHGQAKQWYQDMFKVADVTYQKASYEDFQRLFKCANIWKKHCNDKGLQFPKTCSRLPCNTCVAKQGSRNETVPKKRKVHKYKKLAANQLCLEHTAIKSAEECETAAKSVGLRVSSPIDFWKDSAYGPKGCSWGSWYGGVLIFNKVGNTSPLAAPICVEECGHVKDGVGNCMGWEKKDVAGPFYDVHNEQSCRQECRKHPKCGVFILGKIEGNMPGTCHLYEHGANNVCGDKIDEKEHWSMYLKETC